MTDRPTTDLKRFAGVAVREHGATADQRTGISNPAILYIASRRTSGSQRVTRSVLNQIAQLGGFRDYFAAPWTDLNREGVLKLLQILSDRNLAAATRNLYLATLKGVANEAFLSRQLDHDEYTRIKAIRSAKFTRLPRGRALPIGEVGALMDHCLTQEGVLGLRDGAILAVFFGCGIRRAELSELTLASLLPKDNAIKLIGKGDKERVVPMPARTRDIVNLWLDERGLEPGPLFIRFKPRKDRLSEDHVRVSDDDGRAVGLSTTTLYKTVLKRVVQAGLERATPHDLRRSFITYLLDQGVSLGTVAHMAGHANVNTTQIYNRHKDQQAKEAAEKIEF